MPQGIGNAAEIFKSGWTCCLQKRRHRFTVPPLPICRDILAKPVFDFVCDDALLAKITNELHQKFGIEHATLQVEFGDPTYPCRCRL